MCMHLYVKWFIILFIYLAYNIYIYNMYVCICNVCVRMKLYLLYTKYLS